MDRAAELVGIAGLHKHSSVAEIGCGDAMVCAALDFYGCRTLLLDVEDWRDERARHLKFELADPCAQLPIEAESADLVFSYNTFEHLYDPATAFSEALRICKPGGLVHLSFDPLYCSPWGLHAYRTIHMPYAQFLFSEEFIKRKTAELGIIDLGARRKTLQPLNKWRLTEFLALWQRSDCTVERQEMPTDIAHLDLIERYPRAFSGRNLASSDVITTGITVSLRKS
jgi:SAM-dependent methyltransferase